MELHSYAKRKVGKKWSIEHKRKLVEARISHDTIFSNCPTNSLLPWKKLVSFAKLDDYNVFFVRKQWAGMVARYKQYKQNRIGNISTKAIDDDMVQKITQEWEFFEPIHRLMTRKTTNLHSYALTRQHSKSRHHPDNCELSAQAEKNINEQLQQVEGQQNSNSSLERMHAFSSDTNEDYAIGGDIIAQELETLNTDHDFYTKKTMNYFADVSEDTRESNVVELTTVTTNVPLNGVETEEVATNFVTPLIQSNPIMSVMEQKSVVLPVIHEDAEQNGPTTSAGIKPPQPRLSERDKYYRHKRRFHHRLERRFDTLLNVFGQVIKAEYPSINVSALIGDGGAGATAGAVFKSIFSSDEDDTDSAAEEANTTEVVADDVLMEPQQQ